MTKPRERLFWLACALAIAALIFFQSSRVAIAVQDRPLNLVFGESQEQRNVLLNEWGHAAAHLGLYAALAFCLHRAAGRASYTTGLLAVALASIYGIGDEWHQSLTSVRGASADDIALDFLGALTGAATSTLLYRVVRRRSAGD